MKPASIRPKAKAELCLYKIVKNMVSICTCSVIPTYIKLLERPVDSLRVNSQDVVVGTSGDGCLVQASCGALGELRVN